MTGLDQSRQLAAVVSAELDPLFRRPTRLGVESAWYGHVPFAHWIVGATRPSSIVELGTYNGVSYSAFCDAVLAERIDTRCFAVDTWLGDDHAGAYGEAVFADLERFHDARYGAFSRLLRCTFDDALRYVPDGSIDLLHIDGRHGYDDVRHDFSTWEPKLSSRAVVLFHDTNVREREFGVWRFWQELRTSHRSFEFLHAYGLGVLAHGPDAPPSVAALCQLSEPDAVNAVRERFALLGERWVTAQQLSKLETTLESVNHADAELRSQLEQAQAGINRLLPAYQQAMASGRTARMHLAEARYAHASREQELLDSIADLQHQAAEQAENAEADAAKAAALATTLDDMQSALGAAQAQVARLEHERAVLLNSRIWRLTAPLRRLGGALARRAPPPPAPTIASPATPPTPEPPVIEVAALAEQIRPDPVTRRILFVSAEPDAPGHTYRVARYVAAANALGWQADWTSLDPIGPQTLMGMHVVVLWRVAWSHHVQGIIDHSHDYGAVVLFDVDDLMFKPDWATVDLIDGIRSQGFAERDIAALFRRVRKTMEAVDLITCTTAELAAEARELCKPVHVLPNGFDDQSVAASRFAARVWRQTSDGLIRIGYASGSRTHQRDFQQAAGAIARILRENAECRLVLFRDPRSGEGVVLLHEFTDLAGLDKQIEWRDMVPLAELPREMARFDINIAPLEVDNIFCEAKSELKYFEAALVGVPTVASPTAPFRRAIEHEVTGILATDPEEWYSALTRLVGDAALRRRIGREAYHDALWRFGPHRRSEALLSLLEQIAGGRSAARSFELDLRRARLDQTVRPHIPDAEILFESDKFGRADVTVILPVYNYADYLPEALESVRAQTLKELDLVVVDDCSPDDSAAVALNWLERHAARFNRVVLLRHRQNAGLGYSRNSGFCAAETPFVLPLDPDNRLRVEACSRLLSSLQKAGAAFAYPAIQMFGDKEGQFGTEPFSAIRFVPGNYVDAMALVAKWAWAAAGGYHHVRHGWEDYDFWCRIIELGLWGSSDPEVLADYRVHRNSMLRTETEVRENKKAVITELEQRHPWLDIAGNPE
jgi:glycosyltransferase involved in cell wall biosynthesis